MLLSSDVSVAEASATTPLAAYNFPSQSPAHLLSEIQKHEQLLGSPANNLLFFQMPSHLPLRHPSSFIPSSSPFLSGRPGSTRMMSPLHTSSMGPPHSNGSNTAPMSPMFQGLPPSVHDDRKTDAMPEELDLGDVSKLDVQTEEERIRAEQRRKQQQKLQVFSAQAPYSMKYLPQGALGELRVCKR